MAQKNIARSENTELRAYAKEKRVFLWQVADAIGVSEATLIRWFRFPLSEDKKAAFIKAVDELSKEREG